jgi:peptidoglycan/xylan/chitin deacetylase (PgdA/CDA1 family)
MRYAPTLQERSLTVDTCCNPSQGEWFSNKPTRLRTAASWTTARIAAGLQTVYGNRSADGFCILMYHRVSARVPGVEAPTANVTPQQLRRQLAGLLALGFEAWPLQKLVAAQRESQTIPSRVFAVTFDDGYENNYSNAWPILRELNVPATIFLATKYLDTDRPFPFDDWPATGTSRVATSAWRPLSTDQCSEMLAEGLIELGAHTHSHGRFLGRGEEFRSDLTLCLDVLRDRFGIERPAFAFPYGDISPELVGIAKELGVACCLSTQHERVRSSDGTTQWGRVYAGNTDTPAILAGKLSGWYSTVATAGKKLAWPLMSLERAVQRPSGAHLSEREYGEVPAI